MNLSKIVKHIFILTSVNTLILRSQQFFQEMNPSLEAPVRKILKHLESCLNEKNDDNKYSILIHSASLWIKMQSKLFGIKFNWEFRLNKLDGSYLKNHFVIPLLFNCAEYQKRELELIKIIQAKDKELDDYKSQGIELTRSKFSFELNCRLKILFYYF